MPVFFVPTWLLVIAGFLIILWLPFLIIRWIVASARRDQEARDAQAYLVREAARRELKEEHRALLNEKRRALLNEANEEVNEAERMFALQMQISALESRRVWTGQGLELAEPLLEEEYCTLRNEVLRAELNETERRAARAAWRASMERAGRYCTRADHILGVFLPISSPPWDWKCVWTRTVSRVECDCDLHLIRMNFEAYADKTDSEFEADVLALVGQLNNEHILELLAHFPEDDVVRIVKSDRFIYSLGVDQTTALKNAGVSDKILDAMAVTSARAKNDPIWFPDLPQT